MKISPEFLMIQEVSSAVIHEKDVEELLNKVLCILAQRMGMMRGTFTLLFGDTLTIEASHGIEARRQKLGQYRMGEGITGMVAENG
ncbi:MAG: sigma-54-dependent Fis family transcriptional regulator, partial [Akkermansia sp.]|nr:sigma-54-dependent Fis family transcriptional regulator [Akkermansia sp.]